MGLATVSFPLLSSGTEGRLNVSVAHHRTRQPHTSLASDSSQAMQPFLTDTVRLMIADPVRLSFPD